MRRILKVALFAWSLLAASWSVAQETITPTPVDAGLLTTPPFSYNGLIISSGASASASMIGQGVMATAGHVVYNDTQFTWVPASSIQFYPRWNQNRIPSPGTDTFYAPVAYYKWEEYSTRVQNDDSGPGLSTPDTFNLDFAVGYFSSSVSVDSIIRHAELNIDGDGEISVIRHPREKMVVGYPQDTILATKRGLMHLTQPAVYEGYDAIYEDYDSGFLWASVYNLDGVTTYGGASGGPIYVRDDMNNWTMAGVVDGSNGSTGMLVRSIDDNTWYGTEAPGLIKQAIIARNGNALMRVEDLQVRQTSAASVELTWTDNSTQESGYTVYKQDRGTYSKVAELPANAARFVDNTIQAGHTYHYQVQPYNALGNRAPKSKPARVVMDGTHQDAQNFLNASYLNLKSTGDSSWYVDDATRLRAGLVRSMGSSSLVLQIIGPGIVSFDWTVSCEENPEYSTPGAQYEGDIYDAIRLFLDNVQVNSGDEPVFLSGPAEDDPTGLKGPVSVQFTVPAGSHTVEWRYQKDPYADHHQDTGFLDSMTWTPDPAAGYPVYGAYGIEGTTWHASEWFGIYDGFHLPWVFREDLGWLYLLGRSPSNGSYVHSSDSRLGTMYTHPDIWPFLYRAETGTWVYFYEGSGKLFGIDAVLWDFTAQDFILLGN